MSRGSRVRSPPGVSCAISVMVIIDASQALDPGSIPGWRIGALAQSEECVLCKHEVRGSKPRCSRPCSFFSFRFAQKKVRSSEGSGRSARLGWPSGLRRSTQVRVSSEAWVRIPFQAVHFLLFGGDAGACRLATPVSAGRWSSGMILL